MGLLMLAAFSARAMQNAAPATSQNPQERGARNAGVRPKRPAPNRNGSNQLKRGAGIAAEGRATLGTESQSQSGAISNILATADFDLVGLAATTSPATQSVPKNTPTSVLTSIQVPLGSDAATIIAGLNPNYRVRGELTGPSFGAPLTLEAPLGQPINIPPLSQSGDHILQNLRVVDTGAEGQPVVASVTPDACGIVVFERILISEVHVNELTPEQIRQAGITITDDSYQAFNFTLGLGTTSLGQTINIPVAFPPVGVNAPLPVVGTPTISAPGIDVPTVIPVLLKTEGDGTPNNPGGAAPMAGGEPVQIPGVIVFPGRVGFLHQFFEAILVVSNGAPGGTPLIVRNLHGKALLPNNGTPGDATDDPLRIAATQTGGRVSELDLHGLGPDGKYGTADDTTFFGPGQSGQATFLLEGLKEGLHQVNFDIEATLDGLPGGALKVKGEASGAVLVRDVSFAVSFTHPSVVRAGQEYDLSMTVYNSGSRNIQGAFAQLAGNSISGAELIGTDDGRRQFQDIIKSKESATIKWRLRANTTGEVTASYVKVGENVEAGLRLVTGVGDRNVPLSPESLILPEPVRHLPPSVVEAARAMLGQAWSIANAPPGSLPRGVAPMTKQVVINRAVELGIAGMRVDFGEPASVSLSTVMRDWLGELQDVPDPGFADALRNNPAGYDWYDSLGAEFYKRLTGQAPVAAADLHQEFANTEAPRSQFISALVTQADAPQSIVGARLIDAQSEQVGFGASDAERAGDLQAGGGMRLMTTNPVTRETRNVGQMMVVSNPAAEQWTLELNGWQAGTVDISLLVPASSSGTYRQLVWSNVSITQGGKYRVRFKPLSVSTPPVLEELSGGAYQPVGGAAVATTLNQPAPRVVGAIQVTDEVIPGGDKYGRLVGLLFSKPMAQASAETISRYKIGGGALRDSNPPEQVGAAIKVTGAKLDYGDRFVFLGLDSPIGPYIQRDITLTGLSDTRRMSLTPSPATMQIQPRVSPEGIPPGAYLTGRVMNADGTPVANAPVIYWVQECPNPALLLPSGDLPRPIAQRVTDAQGRYAIDYVRSGDCAPLIVSVTNPKTNSEKRLTTSVAYDGQHLVFDLVFLARGNVQGTITRAGVPMPKAYVQVVPSLDVMGTRVVQADDSGHYVAKDVPVGNVSVLAVGAGDAALSSGLAAGTITGPGQTATINVSLQNTPGIVRGRVLRPEGSPAIGSLVVAYARIPGFITNRGDGATAVGYAFTDRDGSFRISNLPLSNITLEVTDYVAGLYATQHVQLTDALPEVSGVLITLPGLGGVSGRVTDENGSPIAKAIVSAAGGAVRTDDAGNYELKNIPAGVHTVTAQNPETSLFGSAMAQVRMAETTRNVNISIVRPSTLNGHVYMIDEGTTTPHAVAGVKVTTDGQHIVETAADGSYTLNNVQANAPLTLRFVHVSKSLAVNTPVIMTPGETLTRDATFAPGSIHGKVYQPDGVTPTIAQVSLFAPRPYLQEGEAFGLLSTDEPITTNSASDGSYTVTGQNPGIFRASASNVFFPTTVSNGGKLAPSGTVECNLTLVSTLAGKIQGRVFQPDGTTPVGAGVRVTLGGGSLAEITVKTDEQGHYEFAEVFPAGTYYLIATDILSGYSNRIHVSVQKNKDAVFDLRLLGTGNLRVHVVDGAGQPARSGSIAIDGTDYPNAHRYAQITPSNDGIIEFSNLPEGAYAVAAEQSGLGGRAAATVPRGSTVETTLQLQASGTVQGHVYMPGGTVPIGLADVELRVGGRSVGFTVTSDTDTNRGAFSFLNVPTGDFTLDVFDNRTGRVGRSAGQISAQGQVADVRVELLPVGAVAGRVTTNGNPVDHALVHISADGSGIRGASASATTDPDGRYRFTGIPVGKFRVDVSDAPGGQTGSVTGTVNGTVEPLPDTIADIALEPSLTVTGTVRKLGGTEVVPGANVTVSVGYRSFRTATNEQGVYRLSFVPVGPVHVRAEAPTGYDRGEGDAAAGTAGSTVTADVTLTGTGNITGIASDSNGAPLTQGTIVYTNDEWSGAHVSINTAVQADGSYDITNAPVGHFSLKLSVPNRVGVGSAAGDVLAGQTVNVPIRIENAGRVMGRVTQPDGNSPATGMDVVLTLSRPGFYQNFYTHTDSQGVWNFDNIPLGTVSVYINDLQTGAAARADNASLSQNGQVLDLGLLVLDNTAIRVESVTPVNGTAGISPTTPNIVVNFSEPANSSTIYSNVGLWQGETRLSLYRTDIGPDGRSVKLTPAERLADTTTYTIRVTTGLTDLTGHALKEEYRSSFVTADITPPVVAAVEPAANASDVASNALVTVSFNEPLDRSQNLSDIIKVAGALPNHPEQPVAGTVSLDETGKIATFHPAAPINDSSRYSVTVTGQKDASGNAQSEVFRSSFSTTNPAPTVSLTNPAEGATLVESQSVELTATASDNTGIKQVQFSVNGTPVGVDTVSPFSQSYTVPAGITTLTITATATDDLGKTATDAHTVNVSQDRGGTIVGIVTNQNNQPIGGAQVQLIASDGSFTTTTASDGSYQFDPVAIGDVTVKVTDPLSHLRGRATSHLNSFADTLAMNVRLAAYGTVTGTVFQFDHATPQAGASVVLQLSPSGTVVGNTTSDAQGRYTIDFVPVGSFTVDASDAATGDAGRATGQISSSGETRTVDVFLSGLGKVVVTVKNGANVTVGGAQLNLTSQPSGRRQTLTSLSDGTAVFEKVLAGSFTVSATDPATHLSGLATGSVTAGGTTNLTVQLQPSGTLTGHVYEVDGTTAVAGATLKLYQGSKSAILIQQVTSGGDGSYSLDAVQLGSYNVEVLDGAGRTRARVNGVSVTENGQSITRDFSFVGLGTVTGRVLNPDGSAATSMAVSLRSLNASVGGYAKVNTDGQGIYTLTDMPAGDFVVSASDTARQVAGERQGTLGDGQSVTADIQLQNSAAGFPTNWYDINGFYWDVVNNGATAHGNTEVFRGDRAARDGSFFLDITNGGTTARFTGGAATTAQNGREVVIRQQSLAGLDVTRKVYVPRDGYFARYLEVLRNPGASPLTVSVSVQANYEKYYDWYFGPPTLISTSSGDNQLSVSSSTNPDRWLVVDDTADADPFKSFQLPAVSFIFDGAGAAQRASSATFSQPNLSGEVRYNWTNITIPAGGTVSFMHFSAQETSRRAARAAAERLAQSPPETLAGLSAEEVGQIQNFNIPSNGISTLAPLGDVRGHIRGRVLAGDSSLPIANSEVSFQSNNPIFEKSFKTVSNGDGAFAFDYFFGDWDNSIPIPMESFTLTAVHPYTGVTSTPAVGNFVARETTATRDVIFSNTAVVRGFVRRHTGAPVTSGSIFLSGGNPFTSQGIWINSDGSYLFTGVSTGNLTLTAYADFAEGSPLTGSKSITLAAGQTLTTDVLIEPSGAVSGTVHDTVGGASPNVTVHLHNASNSFERTTTTDANGHYTLADLPVGAFQLDVYEPVTGAIISAQVSVVQDQTTTHDVTLPGYGQIQVQVNYANGSPAAGAVIDILESASGSFYGVTTTDGAGRATLEHIPLGNFTLEAHGANNWGLYADVTGVVSRPQEVVQSLIVLPTAGGVTGRVTYADGSPAANAYVELYGGDTYLETWTDASGQYSYTQVPVGTQFTVTAYDPTDSNFRRTQANNLLAHDGDTLTINFTLPARASVRVKVLQANGTPYANAYVYYKDAARPYLQQAGQADANGMLLIPSVAEGKFGVLARPPWNYGFAGSKSGTVAATDNGKTLDVTISAPVTGYLSGTLYASDGETPLRGLRNTVYLLDVATDEILAAYSDYYYSYGTYSFYGVPVSTEGFRVRAYVNYNSVPYVDSAVDQFSTEGESKTINMTLPKAVIKGTVRYSDGTPVPNPYGFADQLRANGTRGDTFYTATSDAQGHYAIPLDYPGNFTLTVQDSDRGLSKIQAVNITDPLPSIIDINMPPTATISGKVMTKDASGNLVGVGNANITVQGSSFNRYFNTDSSGSFSISKMPLGDFAIEARSQTNYGLFTRTCGTLSNEGENVTVNIILPDSGTVTGTVYEADGITPLSGVEVYLSSQGLNTSRNATTNANGVYTMTGIPVGPFILQARHYNYSNGQQKYATATGLLLNANGTAIGNITMLANAPVSGKITRSDGTPLGNTYIYVRAFAGYGRFWRSEFFVYTDAAGNYSVPNAPVGLVRVDATDWSNRSLVGFAQANLTAAGLTGLNVSLGNATAFPYNLDGTDGFRYDVYGDGSLSAGGTIDGRLKSWWGCFYLRLNGDYSRSVGGTIPELDGRQLVIGPTMLQGLLVTRKVYVPREGKFVRFMEVLTNPTATDITLNAYMETSIQSDKLTRVFVSPNSNGNLYGVVDNPGSTTNAANGFVMGGPGARVTSNYAQFMNGNGFPFYTWNVTIPAGQTRILMHYGVQRGATDAAGAKAQAEALANLTDAQALDGLTEVEKSQVLNFNIPTTIGSQPTKPTKDQKSATLKERPQNIAGGSPRRLPSGVQTQSQIGGK